MLPRVRKMHSPFSDVQVHGHFRRRLASTLDRLAVEQHERYRKVRSTIAATNALPYDITSWQ